MPLTSTIVPTVAFVCVLLSTRACLTHHQHAYCIVLVSWHHTLTHLQAVQPRITNQWGQYCYSLHKPPADGLYFWNLNVGKAAAYTTYFIDDVTLTSEPNSAWANWVSTAPVSRTNSLCYSNQQTVLMLNTVCALSAFMLVCLRLRPASSSCARATSLLTCATKMAVGCRPPQYKAWQSR